MIRMTLAVTLACGLSIYDAEAAGGCGRGCHETVQGACVIDGWTTGAAPNECQPARNRAVVPAAGLSSAVSRQDGARRLFAVRNGGGGGAMAPAMGAVARRAGDVTARSSNAFGWQQRRRCAGQPASASQRCKSTCALAESARCAAPFSGPRRRLPSPARGFLDRRKQAEVDIHRLERARAGVDRLDMAAGDMVQQRADRGRGGGARTRPPSRSPRRGGRRSGRPRRSRHSPRSR